MHRLKSARFLNFIFGIVLFSALQVCAQTASIKGQVKDESGAMIPGATVTATGVSGNVLTAVSAADGSYSLKSVPNGSYRIEAAFTGFAMKAPVAFVERGQDANLNLVLNVSAVVQNVTVQAQDSATVSVDSGNNASAVVLSGSKLDSLADNPDDLASDLQALAGPSAGPNGGSVYINGFSTGEMPPKESIREIRINQNPFSPEYDSLGLGRIEIFTKPGSGQFHGSAAFNLGSSIFNSRNPYAAVKAPFLLREFGTSLAGPLNDRERRLVHLALAIGADSRGAAHSHARRGLSEGLSAEDLEHVALLTITTLGWPRAIRALMWVWDVTDEDSSPSA